MAATEENMETRKPEEQSVGKTNVPNANKITESAAMNRLPIDKSGLASHRHHQASGRPPHAPYSRQHQGYQGQFAGYNGTSKPPQQLQSVVTSSFSAEDERDPSHRGTYPPVPRHVNISMTPAEHQRWAGPPEDRYPPEQLEVDVREHDQDGRQQPPTEEPSPSGKPAIVPPSPARGRFPPLSRGLGSSGSFMAPPEPLKRSFWHHSRPNDEYNSSLPPEFIPPKRTKVAASPRGDGHPSGLDMRDMRRPPLFFNRSLSWDSRDETSYYHAPPPPPQRQSPRYSSDHNRPCYPNNGGPSPHQNHHHHHPSPSPPAPYREDEMSSSMSEHSRSRSLPPTPRGHHGYPLPPPSEIGYNHHHSSPSNAAAVAAAAAHHGRRWIHHDGWQPSMPSPTSGQRRSPTNYHHPSYAGSPNMHFRDDMESSRAWSQTKERESMQHDDQRRHPHFDGNMNPESTFQNGPSPYHPNPYYGRSVPPMHQKMAMPPLSPMNSGRGTAPVDAPGHREPLAPGGHPSGMDQGPHDPSSVAESFISGNDGKVVNGKDGPLLLLALPQDRISLSETLCVVRENIEVFTATKVDVDAPAPGRKHAVVVGQVGLRCIHCRHTTRSSDRVKRAVCYPSSIKRIYRTVIDMKLDHFLQCKFVPAALKERLTELKVKHTRSTGTTMQYFIRAAHSLGLEDGQSGVYLNTEARHRLADMNMQKLNDGDGVKEPSKDFTSDKPKLEEVGSQGPAALTLSEYRPIPRLDSLTSENSAMTPDNASEADKFFTGKINLALPEDKMALSPLRCFLRSQVCAFSATAEDIAVRAPTTFSITVGQVGIGCIHCVNQPSKLRSNRAVCFPFSISRIYQSVADIQRFHFGECKMLPPDVKNMFLKLQSASSKGSKGLATRQYWITSAKKLGLVDTPRGIRFGRDPSRPEATSMSLDILAQVAFNVTTASRALVLPEDKPFIAEFLYLVMEQLQPCRFTEADRNKRRLKDVGCIGVECKHCAGQVDGRKFFWSSVNAVESNFVSVHTHMMECRMVPDELKEKLGELKKLRKEQTAALKTGSQKAFFSRVWARLHGEDGGSKGDAESGVNSTTSASATSSPPLSSGCPSPMMSESDSIVVAGVSDDMRHMSVVEI